tara:strand:- start:1785 stop:1955 length:171 start_codon:yes stop_codon:yes gene_type:complete
MIDYSRFNWGIIGILIGTILVWWSIFSNGIFTTLTWLVVIACIIGIIIRVKEDSRV